LTGGLAHSAPVTGTMTPIWSPDGQWVIGLLNVGGVSGIYAVSADGSGQVAPIASARGSAVSWVGSISTNVAANFSGYGETELSIAAPAYVPTGKPFSYSFSITGHGPQASENLALTNPIPAGFAIVQVATSLGTAGVSGGQIVAELGAIPSGTKATVTVTAIITNSGTFNLAAVTGQDLPDSPLNSSAQAPLVAIQGVAGVIPNASGVVPYTFSVTGGTHYYYFDSYTPSDAIQWRLDGPAGQVVANRSFNHSDGGRIDDGSVVFGLAPGDYTLTVLGAGDTTPAYGFNFTDLSTAGLIAIGATNLAVLNPANSTLYYQFAANAGDEVQVAFGAKTNLDYPNSLRWRIVSPFGAVLASGGPSTSGPIQLQGAGNYVLLVEGDVQSTGVISAQVAVVAAGNNPPAILTGPPIQFGAPVQWTNANSADVVHFTLHVATTTTFILDNLAAVRSYNWSLTGPWGAVVTRSVMYWSGLAGGQPAYTVPAGDYDLSITGDTGPSSFQLLDLAGGGSLALNTPISVTNTPVAAAAVLHFTGVSGSRLFQVGQPYSGYTMGARLVYISPLGNQVANLSADEKGYISIPVSGEYSMVISGFNTDAAPAGVVNFALETVVDTTESATLGTLIASSIDNPGSSRRFNFHLDQAKQIYFDVITNNSRIQWTLDGPAGRLVDHRSFAYSDADSGYALFNLPAGDYALTVSPFAETTGAFAFRLLDLAVAQPFTPGVEVDGVLSPSTATDVYAFSAAAGQSFYADMLAQPSPPNGHYRIIDPTGQVVAENWLGGDHGVFTINVGGSCRLLIEGSASGGANSAYKFNLRPVSNASGALALNTSMIGAISSPGSTVQYHFSIPDRRLVYMDNLTNAPGLTWTLDGPGGRFVDHSGFGASFYPGGHNILSLRPGAYTLSVAGNGATVGGYAFRLLDLSNGAPVTPGQVVDEVLDLNYGTAIHTFESNPGDSFFLDFTGVTNAQNTGWWVVDAWGGQLASGFLTPGGQAFASAVGGPCTLFIEDWNGTGAPAGYEFALTPIVNGLQALTMGASTAGSIYSPGRTQVYTFTLAHPTTLDFDALTNAYNVQWQLNGPWGQVSGWRPFSQSDAASGYSAFFVPAGDYQLIIGGAGDFTGPYQFRVLDLNASPGLAYGVGVSGTLAPGNRTDAYQFQGAAGDQIKLQGTGSGIYLRIIDPAGGQTFTGNLADFGAGSQTFTLGYSGVYNLLVEGRIEQSAPLAYNITVTTTGANPPPPFIGTPLVFGATYSGPLDPGASTNFTFSLSSPRRIGFDALSGLDSHWTLTGSPGQLQSDIWFRYSDTYRGPGMWFDLLPGDYQVNVHAGSSYGFRLLDGTGAPQAPVNTVVLATNTPGNSTTVWRLPGRAGDQYYFRGLGFAGTSPRSHGKLLVPSGGWILWEGDLDRDSGVLTLPQTGDYLFWVELPPDDTSASAAFSFEWLTVTNTTKAIVPGQLVTDAIGSPGQQVVYTFNLSQPTALTFDSRSSLYNTHWRLVGPKGSVYGDQTFEYSDYNAAAAVQRMDLPAAAYQLVVWADDHQTPSYQFALLDYATATPITPGVRVVGTNTPANGSVLLSFQATAGQSFYQQGFGESGFTQDVRMNLFSPNGDRILNTSPTYDSGVFTVPITGLYQYLVTSAPEDGGASGVFSFNLIPVNDVTAPLVVGQVNTGAFDMPGQKRVFTFHLDSPARLVVDNLTNRDDGLYLTLDGPAGRIASESLYYSDAYNGNPVLDCAAGDYALTLTAPGSATPGYAFRIVDTAVATDITPGSWVQGSVTPGDGVVAYRFNARTGDRFYFDVGASAGYPRAPIGRLIPPTGGSIQSSAVNSQFGPFNVPQTGAYLWVVFGWPEDEGATGTYSFNFIPDDPQPAVPLNAGPQPFPDLVVSGVQASPSPVLSGGVVTVNWMDQNAGGATATNAYSDRVTIRNGAGRLLAEKLVEAGAALAAGGSVQLSTTLTLPDGPAATGILTVTVTADARNEVAEQNLSGTGESNNANGAVVTGSLAPYPDLQVTGLSAHVAGAWLPGAKLNVAWTDTNSGAAPAPGPWVDGLVVSNTTLHLVLYAGQVLVTNNAVGPAAAAQVSTAVTLPNDTTVYGDIVVLVNADAADNVAEYNAANTAESNNAASTDLPSAPDLAVASISAPGSVTPGTPFTLVYVITNTGSVTVQGTWIDQTLVEMDGDASTLHALGSHSVTATIPPGGSATVTNMLTLPVDGDAGALRLGVKLDAADLIAESDETNNTAFAPSATTAPLVLTLTLNAPSVHENAQPPTVGATVTRNGSRVAALTVTPGTADPTRATVPATVVIPPGGSTASFTVTAMPDGIVTPPRPVDISVAAAGYAGDAVTLTVLNDDVVQLLIAFATNRLVEGYATTATVTRIPAEPSPLTVQLLSSDPAHLGAPATVTIPAGQPAVSFPVTAVQNNIVDGTNTYTVTAIAAGYPGAAGGVSIEGDNIPAVTLSLLSHTVSETDGPNATSLTVTRSPAANFPVTVSLTSSDPTAAKVPGSVVIGPGQASVSVPVAAQDDGVVNGNKAVVIDGWVLNSVTGAPLREATPEMLTVTEGDGPTLKLQLADLVVREGKSPATTGTVSRNTSPAADLSVALQSSLPAKAAVPASVVIPAGSSSATFPVTTINNGQSEGDVSVTFTASAAGFTNGSATLLVTDANLPDLVVASIRFATNGLTGGQLAVTYRVENRGAATATNTFSQRIFLSSDNVVGNDTLVAQIAYPGPIPAGGSFEQTVNAHLPAAPGNYWFIVVADVNGDVNELSKANNTLVSPSPVAVGPAYSATVATDVITALAGTDVPLYGLATLAGGSQPAANVPVTVFVAVRGIQRQFNVVTGPDGKFTADFHPLPTEAGDYTLAASYPNLPMPAVQDTFTLTGFGITPVGLVTVVQNSSVSLTTRVNNMSEVALAGLTAEVVTNHPSLNVTASLGTNRLAGDGSITLAVAVTALNTSAEQSTVQIRVTSQEGASADLWFPVRQSLLLPQLAAAPGSLNATMLRGGQTPVAFTVANSGGADTGPLGVLLPQAPWLSLASPALLASLPPGSNAVVTLLLTPPADLPFGDYNGTVVLQSTNSALSVPYTFRPISNQKGAVAVAVEDEYTYFVAGSPRVTNATVTLTDALTGTTVSTNWTDADGTVLLTNVTEAFYILDVKADGHSPYRNSVFVPAGATTNVTAFLTRETVHYSFTVVPTTVQDHYTLQVDSTLETQVPVPVVTITPQVIDFGQYPGAQFQVDLTVANQGLIDARDVNLNIPSTAYFEITPLVTNIGKLSGNTSLVVPVMVRRLTPGQGAGRGVHVADFNSGSCSVTGSMLWNYLCGPNVVNKNTAVYGFDSTGCDLVSLYRQVYDLVPDGGGGGGGGGGGWTSDSFFDYLETLNPVTDFEPPPGYHFQCKAAPGPGRRRPILAGNDHTLGGSNVCAKVSLHLDQRAVLTRDAFKATLDLGNDTDTPLKNVFVTLNVSDANGKVVTSTFGVGSPTITGFDAVDGTGTLPGHSDGTAEWTLVPSLDAAPTNGAAFYLVGGTLSYDQGGAAVTIPLAPAPINVHPQPELVLRYFHDRDVYGDDPFTPEIEPSQPYFLAVQINNVGYGAAHDLSITGAKPQIVENIKGLLIQFQLLGVLLENTPVAAALDVNFGEIGPSTNKTALWEFTSNLQGSFTNFSASFSETDDFGGKRLSLVRNVEIHELSHIVDATGPAEDGRPDFLVNDVSDQDFIPDTLYLSDGSTAPVTAVTNAVPAGAPGPGSLETLITPPGVAGWAYIRFQDPGLGDYNLRHVFRSDGTEVPFGTNVWTSTRFFRGGDLRPINTNLVHIFDLNPAGAYRLVYAPAATGAADTNPPTTTVAALPASSQPTFGVQWSGSDNPGGGGLAYFDVYVSVDGGPYTPWQSHTTLQGGVYTGEVGRHYAFYSVGTDIAGNRETAPAGPQSETFVPTGPRPPQLSFPGDVVAYQGDAVQITPTASDPDGLPLTFALGGGAPASMQINPQTGVVSWATSKGDLPGRYTITVIAADNGIPALTATNSVNVTLNALNTPPILAGGSNAVVTERELIVMQFTAGDADLPRQTLTFSLDSGAPAGAEIDPADGRFQWRPAANQGGTTNIITVRVTDSGTPPMSAETTFTVVVRETFAALFATFGHTNVFAGRSGLAPLSLNAAPDVTNVTFTLTTPASALTGLAFQDLASDVIAATVTPGAGDTSLVSIDLAGGVATAATREAAHLAFTASGGPDSVVAPLAITALSGLGAAGRAPSAQGRDGYVVVVGSEPVLVLEPGAPPVLRLYGQPGGSYAVEHRPIATGGAWSPYTTLTLSGPSAPTVVPTPVAADFFRARGQ
jgi:CARDB/Domain of unknown function DUF11